MSRIGKIFIMPERLKNAVHAVVGICISDNPSIIEEICDWGPKSRVAIKTFNGSSQFDDPTMYAPQIETIVSENDFICVCSDLDD